MTLAEISDGNTTYTKYILIALPVNHHSFKGSWAHEGGGKCLGLEGFLASAPEDQLVKLIHGSMWSSSKLPMLQYTIWVLNQKYGKISQFIHFNRVFHYKLSILGEKTLFLETPIYWTSSSGCSVHMTRVEVQIRKMWPAGKRAKKARWRVPGPMLKIGVVVSSCFYTILVE